MSNIKMQKQKQTKKQKNICKVDVESEAKELIKNKPQININVFKLKNE